MGVLWYVGGKKITMPIKGIVLWILQLSTKSKTFCFFWNALSSLWGHSLKIKLIIQPFLFDSIYCHFLCKCQGIVLHLRFWRHYLTVLSLKQYSTVNSIKTAKTTIKTEQENFNNTVTVINHLQSTILYENRIDKWLTEHLCYKRWITEQGNRSRNAASQHRLIHWDCQSCFYKWMFLLTVGGFKIIK